MESRRLNIYGLPVGVPKPTRDLVLLRRLEAPKETEGGIAVPEESQQKPFRAVILAAGPGWYSPNGMFVGMCPDYIPGAHVFVNQYAGQEFEVETKVGPAQVSREKYLLVRQDEILAVFDPMELIEAVEPVQ